MNRKLGGWWVVVAAAVFGLSGCTHAPTPETPGARGQPSASSIAKHETTRLPPVTRSTVLPKFTPPPASAIPDTSFGAEVREGRAIFDHTHKYAGAYVGDALSCESCHLDSGRRAGSAPLWAAYVRYPRYRAKNHKVNTFAERLQGCFQFSMNGKAPPADGAVIKALTTYAYWLATNAPTGKNLAGYGYPKLIPPPPRDLSYARGAKVFRHSCALCHAGHGQGQQTAGVYVFPPLWGPKSFNWGAGMANINNAAAFIKANMPFSRGGTLSNLQAWDVALFVDSHARPQDPRFNGNVAATRAKYHKSKWSMYGKVVQGRLLGSAPLREMK